MPEEMNDSLARFDIEAKLIIRSFLDSLGARDAPETIYHYTDDLGLRGILESGTIRLTDIFYLNDPSELRHGFCRAVDLWTAKVASGLSDASDVVAALGEFYGDEAFRAAAHYFTCSFSFDGDDLGQWRAYADNGRGYALGFDRHALESAFTGSGRPPFTQTFPVCYDENELTDLQGRIIEKALPLTNLPCGRDLSTDAIKAFKIKLYVLLTTHAMNIALFFKHKAYRNEQEYRFLEAFPANATPTDVKITPRPYSLTRYREFDWKGTTGFSLTRINGGPAADPEKNTQFARDCLRMYGMPNIEIRRSLIPYRAP